VKLVELPDNAALHVDGTTRLVINMLEKTIRR
jgi:hypothetical protein